jgi:uncharacterized protein (DUF488 family)
MRFFTIGYGGRPPGQFPDLLTGNGVRTVVDVRLRPDKAAMGAYSRAKSADRGIEKLLGERRIAYRSLIELGNPFLEHDDWRAPYGELLDRAGGLLTARIDSVDGPFCLLCAEKRVADCHRQVLADYLVRTRGWTVEHIA